MPLLYPKKLSDEALRGPENKTVEGCASGKRKAVTWEDQKTGLEWEYESPGEMSWNDALEYAKSLSLDGKDDWRLPTAAELETLLDRSILYDKSRPTMRQELPFRDTLSYWSSTTFAPKTHCAWIVMFDGGYILSYPKSTPYCVRCVRG